ncbi:Hsp20/alpha crystallin family protein [Acidovorax sp. NCPPB 3576]|uniref:Hsp20/alpha crystallin family protein n=1 Tax=Acidovorax sp. NCPPB 3576 TaxID=2940488 RepID=UPI00234AC44E|nr:Hsp20/alpha crystallin family protein [Acidovorax sp. NCPPB 3576]WCM87752.1 Hsp20/alpha crystallin family protein [Acidovorax sp. NCPPB 3576]
MRNDIQTSNNSHSLSHSHSQSDGNRSRNHHTGSAHPQPGATRQPAPAPQDRSRYADSALTPPVDVIEDSGGITLYADLPGVSRDKLNLQVESETLTIEAESDLAVPEGLTSSHTEVGLGRFRRVFTLSKELDTERVSAELANGVLKLRIPKAQHAQPRRIEVQMA